MVTYAQVVRGLCTFQVLFICCWRNGLHLCVYIANACLWLHVWTLDKECVFQTVLMYFGCTYKWALRSCGSIWTSCQLSGSHRFVVFRVVFTDLASKTALNSHSQYITTHWVRVCLSRSQTTLAWIVWERYQLWLQWRYSCGCGLPRSPNVRCERAPYLQFLTHALTARSTNCSSPSRFGATCDYTNFVLISLWTSGCKYILIHFNNNKFWIWN